ncbi:hypothetical protein POM88_023833 [Heracleum sosnowskyi]|uniref:BED-type domain-containing protein n=1 Tax=Heracleum sosnowskyi TaxID=360622 RepID=A0AAD8IK71_9APIA|nr:hypothetical protein POM88_023833 [Heracleum sosnowskyi]
MTQLLLFTFMLFIEWFQKEKLLILGGSMVQLLMDIKRKVKCNYCAKIVSGGITRLKQHVAGISENVEPCPSAPKETRVNLAMDIKLVELSKVRMLLERWSSE